MAAAASPTFNFPNAVLTPIATESKGPNYKSIRKAQTELNGNAASVHSNGGTGQHGLLKLCNSDAMYATITGSDRIFEAPHNPPVAPDHSNDTTAVEYAETNRQHKDDQQVHKTYHDVDKALAKLVINATPLVYLRALNDVNIGFGNVTCLQLLDHLWTNYGVITQAELDQNQLEMNAPWHPPSPIEVLFTQLEVGTTFAIAGHEAPSAPMVIRQGYNLIHATGLFETPCREWRNKSGAEKTMPLFQRHFLAADQDRRLTATTDSAGFHSANQAIAVAPSANQASPAPANNSSAPRTSYCWSHGINQNLSHTSQTCENRKENHKESATLGNKMGGSTKNWARHSD